MRRLIVLAAALALAGCGGADLHGDLLIRADRLFDGTRVIEPGAVLVRGERIVAVGEELDADAKRTIDLGDATILPGFIDLHVHDNDPLMVRGGVMTVRNLGAPIETLSAPNEDAELCVLGAGPLVTAPGGYPIPVWGPSIALEVRGENAARAAVRDLARRGAAVIKIALEPGPGTWPMLDVDEVRAIVDEAHEYDLSVTAHISDQRGVELALAGGVDELAHMPCFDVPSEALREVVEREIEVVATLHVIDISRICPDPVPQATRFVALGGRLLYGSDLGNPGIPYGIDVDELRLLGRAGLTPEEVLAAATSRAGEQIELDPLGTLAERAPADVIAVPGDARLLEDDLATPLLVIRGGRIVVESRD
jgi:imidazolonepropionase-like amidohydrolase